MIKIIQSSKWVDRLLFIFLSITKPKSPVFKLLCHFKKVIQFSVWQYLCKWDVPLKLTFSLSSLPMQLYELMVMAFKYQVFLCPRPKDLLLITYNHIDTIREFVQHTPVVVNQVDETHRKVIEVYREQLSHHQPLIIILHL